MMVIIMFDNTDYIIILIKEFNKDENRENPFLNDLLTQAINKESNHDYVDLNILKLKDELNIKSYAEIKPYFDNLIEMICDSDLLISEKAYYRQAYDD